MLYTKHIAAVAVLLISLSTLRAQVKKDTVVLSVYNNNQKFMLYAAPFGAKMGSTEILEQMHSGFDTVLVVQKSPRKDTSGKYPSRIIAVRKCEVLKGNIKDKVAIVRINSDCDASVICMNAQRAGAKAVIIIHTTNNKDSVTLPATPAKGIYIYKDSLKIPCFTVRNAIGDKLLQMLPSLVGIKIPKIVPNGVQTLAQPSDTSKINKNVDNAVFSIYPNPTDDDAYIQYAFTTPTDLNIEISNTTGQVLHQNKLLQVTSGTYTIPSDGWANGIYYIQLRYGKFSRTEKIFVDR